MRENHDSIPLSHSCILWPSTWEEPKRNLKILLLSDALTISTTLMSLSYQIGTSAHLKLCVVQGLKFCNIWAHLLSSLTFSQPHLHFLCKIAFDGMLHSFPGFCTSLHNTYTTCWCKSMTQGVQPLPQQADGEGVRGRGNILEINNTMRLKIIGFNFTKVWMQGGQFRWNSLFIETFLILKHSTLYLNYSSYRCSDVIKALVEQ